MTITPTLLYIFALSPLALITLARQWTPAGYTRDAADGMLYRCN